MSEAKQIYHVPVLLNESVDGMNIQPGGIYVDATFGGGGHSKEILSRLDSTAHLYSFDQDEDAEKNIVSDSRFTFVRSNFRYLSNFLRYYDVEEVDAILADLGVSSHHFDDSAGHTQHHSNYLSDPKQLWFLLQQLNILRQFP